MTLFDTKSGEWRSAREEEHVQACLRAAILTRIGERNDGSLGTSLRNMIFLPLNRVLAMEVATELQRSLTTAEPRVTVAGIEVTAQARNALALKVDYQWRKSGRRGELLLEVRP